MNGYLFTFIKNGYLFTFIKNGYLFTFIKNGYLFIILQKYFSRKQLYLLKVLDDGKEKS